MDRLDQYETKPAGMERYLAAYGWHFSKAMCDWAVSKLRDKDGEKHEPMTKEQLCDMLKKYGEEVDAKGYDAVYVANMEQAKHAKGSITNDGQLAKHIAEEFQTAYDGEAFTHFYSDCIAQGEPILWEELM